MPIWAALRGGLVSSALLCLPVLSACGQVACADSGGCAYPVQPRCAWTGPPSDQALPEGALTLTDADNGGSYTVAVGQVVLIRLPASVAPAKDICAVPGGGESPLFPVPVRQTGDRSLSEAAFRADSIGELSIKTRSPDGIGYGSFSVRLTLSLPTPVCTPGPGAIDPKRAADHVEFGHPRDVHLIVGQVILVSLPADAAPPGQICYRPNRYREAVLEPISISGGANPSIAIAAFVAARPGVGQIENVNAAANCPSCSIPFLVYVYPSPSPSG